MALGNRVPHAVPIQDPIPSPWAWLELQGGRLDLAEAISTSGTVDVVALLVPLRAPEGGPVRVLVETRAPRHLELFRQLHFGPDNEDEKAAFLQAHREALLVAGPVQGLRLRGFIARSNAAKLRALAQEGGLELHPEAFILVAGGSPARLRAGFFLLVALAGLLKVLRMGRR